MTRAKLRLPVWLLLLWKMPTVCCIGASGNITHYHSVFFSHAAVREIKCLQIKALPFWSISKCSQRMSPTKSGAKSRKRSFPIAHRVAPFMQNLSKSTFFRLNSFTVHVSHSATWFSVHCLGSGEDRDCYIHRLNTVFIQHPSQPVTDTQTHIDYSLYNALFSLWEG